LWRRQDQTCGIAPMVSWPSILCLIWPIKRKKLSTLGLNVRDMSLKVGGDCSEAFRRLFAVQIALNIVP